MRGPSNAVFVEGLVIFWVIICLCLGVTWQSDNVEVGVVQCGLGNEEMLIWKRWECSWNRRLRRSSGRIMLIQEVTMEWNGPDWRNIFEWSSERELHRRRGQRIQVCKSKDNVR